MNQPPQPPQAGDEPLPADGRWDPYRPMGERTDLGEARRLRLAEACDVLAERQAARSVTPIANPDAWRRSVAGRLARQHTADAMRILTDDEVDDWPTPAVLADLLEDPQAAERQAAAERSREREAATARIRDAMRVTDTDRARSAAKAAELAAQLRHGQSLTHTA